MTTKHEFALYVAELSSLLRAGRNTLSLANGELVTRIGSVLRLQQGETCTLFDRTMHAQCRIIALSKKSVELEIIEKEENAILQPRVTCLLPLLKRDDLETALYASVELGASVVQLVITEKIQRAWGGAKELDRLQRIMIAAAEQSKNLALPELHAPVPLPEALRMVAQFPAKLFFDVGGTEMVPLLQALVTQRPQEVALLVGPEGDLTAQEKTFVREQAFTVCELTPTVLRAVSASALALGMVRSSLR